MVDRVALEMRSTRKCTGGSNPSLSANLPFASSRELLGTFLGRSENGGSKVLSGPKTALAIKAFKGPGRLSVSDGLYLLVTPQGYRRWQFRYSYAGKQSELALGVERELTLASAKQAAEKAKQTLLQGIDPSDKLSAAARSVEEKTEIRRAPF